MLVIVMHNKIEYLNALDFLAHKEGITTTNITRRDGLGFTLKGHQADFTFQRGTILPQFDKAFIAVVNKLETRRLLTYIQSSDELSIQSLNAEGFICMLPFKKIKNLAFDSFFLRRIRSENTISRILKPQRIQLGLNARTPKEAIYLTARPLEEADEISDFPEFLHNVLAREEVAPTGIGNGIAIPHTRSTAVKKPVISVGRFEKGLDFGIGDDRPVKLLFLIGSPCVKGSELNEYLTTLAQLSRYLNETDFRRSVLAASKAEKVINAFRHIEQGLPEALV